MSHPRAREVPAGSCWRRVNRETVSGLQDWLASAQHRLSERDATSRALENMATLHGAIPSITLAFSSFTSALNDSMAACFVVSGGWNLRADLQRGIEACMRHAERAENSSRWQKPVERFICDSFESEAQEDESKVTVFVTCCSGRIG